MVECLVESIRCQERSTTWLLLATAMRGLTRRAEHNFAVSRLAKMPVFDKVEVLLGRKWTALECVARALRHTKELRDVFRTAGEIQYANKGISNEQLVVNGQSYDMMQCFVKSWWMDSRDNADKVYSLRWHRMRYYPDVPPRRPVVVDGESYVLVMDDATGAASHWEKQEL